MNIWDDFVRLMVLGRDHIRNYYLYYLIGIGIVFGLAWGLHFFDKSLLEFLTNNDNRQWRDIARGFTLWGDFATGSVALAVGIWLIGVSLRRRRWQRAALACLLASAIAGTFANALRLTLGRPRPHSDIADRFYGIRASHLYHGFPSGHAATSFGTATALVVTLPWVGLPTLLGAGGVVWSRMYLKRHYPTDVGVGAAFGIVTGLILGLAARKENNNAN